MLLFVYALILWHYVDHQHNMFVWYYLPLKRKSTWSSLTHAQRRARSTKVTERESRSVIKNLCTYMDGWRVCDGCVHVSLNHCSWPCIRLWLMSICCQKLLHLNKLAVVVACLFLLSFYHFLSILKLLTFLLLVYRLEREFWFGRKKNSRAFS